MALVILGHPQIENSVANRTIIEEMQKADMKLEVRDIAALYPDFKIDIAEEQKALLRHEVIIFQYPIYWYNMPAILKQWFDMVYTYQFAYGSKGDKLKGKKALVSITVGGVEADYKTYGKHNFRISEFFKNVEQTAYFAKMEFLNPRFFHGTSTVDGFKEDDVKHRARLYAKDLLEYVQKQDL
ncbi:NAD(P)H-dependent oxidoreductase [Flavobacterium ginsengiterrae]|uniref:NAD(P)H-dependent oxidoreductase n=1 Tax=Flavobacterium ginsengiterrae TaxID=871695 RepID=A0ABP7G467_9FLAO